MSDLNVEQALDRLIIIARSDTGQSRRVANFLLAWWNGGDWGHFDLSDLFAVDGAISANMATIVAFLGRHPGAIYADAFGRRADMEDLIALWRPDRAAA